MKKYQHHVNYGLYILRNRLHYIETNKPKIYNYYNKKGELTMQSYQGDQVDNKKHFSIKVEDNNKAILELKKDIERLEKNKIDTEDIVFKCDKCKKTACILELFYRNDNNKQEIFQIQTSSFIGGISTRYIGKEEVSIEVFKNIRKNLKNPKILNKKDHDLFGFVCQECNKVYCKDCWEITAINFDEGFYEDTQAVCPKGHKQIIQD
jgi:Fe-S-cluster-containing hydrogenase component 2